MATLFALLFMLAIALLIWGVIAPKSLSKFSSKPLTRRDAGIGFGVAAVLFFVLTSVTAPKASLAPKPGQTKQATTIRPNTNTQLKRDPVVTFKTVMETQTIPYDKKTVNDSTMAKGTTNISIVGINGVKTLTYKVTYTNGKQTDKELVTEEVTKQPIAQITNVGTYVTPTTTTCYPLTNRGNCYEPGEYCRNSDHGARGVAGNGETITCEDNNGWRWEPS